MRWGTRPGKSQPTFQALEAAYQVACATGGIDDELSALQALTEHFPDVGWPWFDLGLRLKWLRRWPASRDANLRALLLLDDAAHSPEAWNLGIAATALGDWPMARRAWAAFGIDLLDSPPEQPIIADLGTAAVRLNPEPRFAESQFEVNGIRYSPEVVWGTRLCPSRMRIENVPLAESGHRFGDVVLHDGDPVGERYLGNSKRSVFNEIALLLRGPHPTLTTTIDAVAPEALLPLSALFEAHEFAAEIWSSSLQVLCRSCSEGTVDARHTHEGHLTPASAVVGIAAPPDAAVALLDPWLAERGLHRGRIEPA